MSLLGLRPVHRKPEQGRSQRSGSLGRLIALITLTTTQLRSASFVSNHCDPQEHELLDLILSYYHANHTWFNLRSRTSTPLVPEHTSNVREENTRTQPTQLHTKSKLVR